MLLITIYLLHSFIINELDSSLVFEKNQPYQLFSPVVEVDFDGIEGDIYTESFRDLISVKQLTIRNSDIDNIDDGALCMPTLMKQLNLFDNWKLPKLTKHVFTDCPHLETMKIVNNNDLIVENFAFSPLRNLRDLLISNQIIKNLTNDLLANLTNLENLRMRFCRIERIHPHAFDDLNNLQTLELVFNNFQTIGDGLMRLNNLRILDLSNNKLENFDWNSLQNLTKLDSIVLSWNNIGNFDTNSMITNLKSVNVLEIEMNPVDCGQRTRIYRDLLKNLTNLDLYIGVLPNGTCL